MIDLLQHGQGLIGLTLILLFVWAISESRKDRPSRW